MAVQGGNNGEVVSGTITAVRTVGNLPINYESQGILDAIHKFCFSRVDDDGIVGDGREERGRGQWGPGRPFSVTTLLGFGFLALALSLFHHNLAW